MAFKTRLLLAGLLFVAEALCYLDRISVAVAAVHLRREGMSEESIGFFLASFFWGYVSSQLPFSFATSKWGGHVVLCIGLSGWGLMTLALPLLSQWSFPLLMASRVLLGVFEGCIFPSVYYIVSRWTPLR
jgi:MFS family permease